MSEQKWRKSIDRCHITTDEKDADCAYIAEVYNEDHLDRIVEEHNACAGIDNVAGFMEKCRMFLSDLKYYHPNAVFSCGLDELLALLTPQKEADDEH